MDNHLAQGHKEEVRAPTVQQKWKSDPQQSFKKEIPIRLLLLLFILIQS